MDARPGALSAGLLAFAMLSAGCISGEFFPADIPLTEADQRNGWTLADQRGGEEGVEPVVKARWAANSYAREESQFPGSVAVISVSDVPVLDEQQEIEKRVADIAAQQDVQISNPRGGTGSVRGDQATYRVYDASGTTRQQGQEVELKGHAIDLSYTCGANGMAVRVFAYAVTEIDTGSALFGTQRSDETWKQVVGDNLSVSDTGVSGALGGLVSRVRCSL